jgi:predicted glycoside hydrolase/deacetylase ChbG (UPF0249 family)
MADQRALVVNADDFGQSSGITQGIIEAFERGIVTSASLMVRGRDAMAAAAYARQRPALSVGLHVDLGEWRCRDGKWTAAYEVAALDDSSAVASEIARQLDRFRELTGADPTHIDSHQHVHRREPVRSAATAVAGRLGVPLRHFSPIVRYCARFYGQTAEGLSRPEWIAPDALVQVIATLPEGLSELACHPAREIDIDTTYAGERVEELATLCAPQVLAAPLAARVKLWSFHDVARARSHVAGDAP